MEENNGNKRVLNPESTEFKTERECIINCVSKKMTV